MDETHVRAVTTKSKVKSTSIPHKHIHSRVSFLYQAATLLSDTGKEQNRRPITNIEAHRSRDSTQGANVYSALNQSRQLLSHVRGISQKSRIKIRREVKRTLCKRCDLLLVPGATAKVSIENKSTAGQKPWADVLIIECHVCGTVKRFPIGQIRASRPDNPPSQA